MRPPGNRIRNGAALLITLMTLVLMLAAITSVAGLAASCKLDREFDRCGIMADDLLFAAEDVILDWLNTESAKVVLPPEAHWPQVHILHDVWAFGQPADSFGGATQELVEVELRITAWDQCGVIPVSHAKAGSPLRLALPEHALATIDSLDQPIGDQFGLDAFARPHDVDSASPFPLPALTSEALHLFGGLHHGELFSRLPTRPGDRIDDLAVGAFVSTHTTTMNLNTAPIAALEQALRQQGRGGIEVVIAARSAGTTVSLASLPSSGQSQDSSLRLAGTSDTWAFRIDVRVGPVQRSWWAIYKPAQDRTQQRTRGTSLSFSRSGGPSTGWECVQRMVIRD